MPAVLNIRDCPGREVPAGAVYIGRGVTRGGYRLAKSKWANPFNIPNKAALEQREHAIASYERWLCDKPDLMAALHELRGRDLCCWCAPLPCHGDVLIRLANA